MKFILEQSEEHITTHSGLSLVGLLVSKTSLKERLNQTSLPGVTTPEIPHGDIAVAYLGLLCQGKSDFDSIEPFREEPFFQMALGLGQTPSSPTLRQRLDMAAKNYKWRQIILEESVNLIKNTGAPVTPITLKGKRYVPLDVDVSPFDNSKTKKEGVSRTYKGFDGYAPIFAYLGEEGYAINGELREGKEHCQKNTPFFLLQSIRLAKQLTNLPLLVRLDSGNDSGDNIGICFEEGADFIIKRNLRKESAEEWLKIAKEKGMRCLERPGKDVYLGSLERNGVRVVFKVIERTIRADGQILLFPEIEVETWWTSLDFPASVVVELYEAHGTSEQFHSEIKTELDLERLPSGKFATNDLVLHLGLLAYNILHIIGQESLKVTDAPSKKKVSRRRIRTVIQNLVYLASRVVYHARRYKLGFSRYCPWFATFKRVYLAFA